MLDITTEDTILQVGQGFKEAIRRNQHLPFTQAINLHFQEYELDLYAVADQIEANGVKKVEFKKSKKDGVKKAAIFGKTYDGVIENDTSVSVNMDYFTTKKRAAELFKSVLPVICNSDYIRLINSGNSNPESFSQLEDIVKARGVITRFLYDTYIKNAANTAEAYQEAENFLQNQLIGLLNNFSQDTTRLNLGAKFDEYFFKPITYEFRAICSIHARLARQHEPGVDFYLKPAHYADDLRNGIDIIAYVHDPRADGWTKICYQVKHHILFKDGEGYYVMKGRMKHYLGINSPIASMDVVFDPEDPINTYKVSGKEAVKSAFPDYAHFKHGYLLPLRQTNPNLESSNKHDRIDGLPIDISRVLAGWHILVRNPIYE